MEQNGLDRGREDTTNPPAFSISSDNISENIKSNVLRRTWIEYLFDKNFDMVPTKMVPT
jgi:hypothetical protein